MQGDESPPACRRLARQPVRGLPHADPHLHGRWSAPRPQFPDPEARP